MLAQSQPIINPVVNRLVGNYNASAPATTMQRYLKNFINLAIGLAGLYFLFTILISGYQYITAGGDKESVQKATARIRNAVIGLVIVLSLFVILYVVETIFGISIRQINIPNI
jgi:hypothetical protein